jgi:hypothetical protein
MKYKTLFRLAIKWLGVWFVVEGLATAFRDAFQIVMLALQGSASMPPFRMLAATSMSMLVHSGVYIAIGLYLFFGGRWVVDRAIPSNRPYCPECGYELTHTAGDACPECGTAVTSPPSAG